VTSVTSDGGARGATLVSQLPKLEGKRELVFTQRSSGGSSSFIAVDITEVYIFFSTHPPGKNWALALAETIERYCLTSLMSLL
jgi:hypothetical protein